MAEDGFTLHRRAWRVYRRLPLIVRIWLVLLIIGGVIELASALSGPGDASRVSAAVQLAVREATGPDPSASCSALSQAGLTQVLSTYVGGQLPATEPAQLAACQQLVAHVKTEVTAGELGDLAGGSVRAVQFQPDGSARVLYIAADHHLAAQLTLSRHGASWLIDDVETGAVAP